MSAPNFTSEKEQLKAYAAAVQPQQDLLKAQLAEFLITITSLPPDVNKLKKLIIDIRNTLAAIDKIHDQHIGRLGVLFQNKPENRMELVHNMQHLLGEFDPHEQLMIVNKLASNRPVGVKGMLKPNMYGKFSLYDIGKYQGAPWNTDIRASVNLLFESTLPGSLTNNDVNPFMNNGSIFSNFNYTTPRVSTNGVLESLFLTNPSNYLGAIRKVFQEMSRSEITQNDVSKLLQDQEFVGFLDFVSKFVGVKLDTLMVPTFKTPMREYFKGNFMRIMESLLTNIPAITKPAYDADGMPKLAVELMGKSDLQKQKK
jgi:hypothetical protein